MKYLTFTFFALVLCIHSLDAAEDQTVEALEKRKQELVEESNRLSEQIRKIYETKEKMREEQKLVDAELEQLKKTKVYKQNLYIKLPIEQAEFHWRFTDRAAYLKGTLDLLIEKPDGSQMRTSIFSDGEFHDGWGAIGYDKPDENKIYFGVASQKPVEVSRSDKLVLHLTLPEDVSGIGPKLTGFLPAGDYTSESSFQIFDPSPGLSADLYASAIRADWSQLWSVEVTEERGWLDEMTPKETEERARKHLVYMLKEEMKINQRILSIDSDDNERKVQKAFDTALNDVIENQLSKPLHQWEGRSNKEIRALYDGLHDKISELNPFGFSKDDFGKDFPAEESIKRFNERKAAVEEQAKRSSEELTEGYKAQIMEILVDIL